MYVLAPSIYAADPMHTASQIKLLEQAGIEQLHVDIMDGHFVPSMAFGPDYVNALRETTDMLLDVHLMIEEPIRLIEETAEAGADIITIHLEACSDAAKALDLIHSFHKKAGIALNPETPLKSLTQEIWDRIEVLHIMTVLPGRKEQSFQPESLQKIRNARNKINALGRKTNIEVDGDITLTHLYEVLEAGANIAVVGKALFRGAIRQNVQKYLDAGRDLPLQQIG